MKKYCNVGIAICTLLCLASCQMGKHSGSNTTFKTKEKNGQIVNSASIENDSLSLFVEYTGQVNFNAGHTSITSISPGGYLKYRKNDKELSAKNEDGGIYFELSDGGREIRSAEERKRLITAAFDAIKYTDSLRNPVKKAAL